MKKSLRNYRLFFHRLGLLFFLLLIIVLVSSIILPDTGFSEKENRVLTSRPALKLDQLVSGGYEKQFETYENDQFPLRDMWITLKATCICVSYRRTGFDHCNSLIRTCCPDPAIDFISFCIPGFLPGKCKSSCIFVRNTADRRSGRLYCGAFHIIFYICHLQNGGSSCSIGLSCI